MLGIQIELNSLSFTGDRKHGFNYSPWSRCTTYSRQEADLLFG